MASKAIERRRVGGVMASIERDDVISGSGEMRHGAYSMASGGVAYQRRNPAERDHQQWRESEKQYEIMKAYGEKKMKK